MDSKEFIERLGKAQDLMAEEKYVDALNILYKLKEIEKKGEFDYSLTHKLYQLISNSESLLNQTRVLEVLDDTSKERGSITFDKLSKILEKEQNITLKPGILRREIELLILRNKIPYKIENDSLIFQ
ncbi:MAG: hypothetical protein ACQERB_06650 [Promethearchaeati archaeon]